MSNQLQFDDDNNNNNNNNNNNTSTPSGFSSLLRGNFTLFIVDHPV
jgi:hypothetical protein